jgi:lipoyl(octanoyl) transferase
MTTHVIVRELPELPYLKAWQDMKNFTDSRDETTPDEIWLLQHAPVYTQGQNGKPENILKSSAIPIVKSDRGGQVTYHGPGQLIVYTLIDVKRKKWNVRQLVSLLEESVIQWLASRSVSARARCDAPGIYVQEKKICSVGLRIRRGCSYHGLALNVDMDLQPFLNINPCGFEALEMTQVTDVLKNQPQKIHTVAAELLEYLITNLGYNTRLITPELSHGTESRKP